MSDRKAEIAEARAVLAPLLGFDALTPIFHGELDGAPVEIRIAAELAWSRGKHKRRRPDKDRRTVRVTLPFWAPLQVGIKAAPREAVVSPEMDGFEPWFALTATEIDRGRALVSAEARAALVESFVHGPGPRLADDGLTWAATHKIPWPPASDLAPAIRCLPRVWKAVTDACRHVRPASGTEEPLVHLASRVRPGIELWGAPSGLLGKVGTVRAAVSVVAAVGGGWGVAVHVRLPRPLSGEPIVVREDRHGWLRRFNDLLLGRPEIEFGDDAFDQQFAVRSLEADSLEQLLGPRVRAGMVQLDRHLPVRLDSKGISATGVFGDAAVVGTLADIGLDLGEALAERYATM